MLMVTYFTQLMTPLNWIGTLYRVIQEAFVNMENMFDLLNEDIKVKDIPGAMDFANKGPPNIEFEDVSFHHTVGKPILKNVNFKMSAGTTTALVG